MFSVIQLDYPSEAAIVLSYPRAP